jgi:AcrR family transcriptional regulator
MNNSDTRETIIEETARLLAVHGTEGFGMREVARNSTVTLSVLYYHFADKDALLRAVFDVLRQRLGLRRALLRPAKTFSAQLKQRIEFQLDNALDVTAILKFYMGKRATFEKTQNGFVPRTAYLHIREVLEEGVRRGEITIDDLDEDAKVITHAINGFVLEYFPDIPAGSERTAVVNSIHRFLMRALSR